MSSKDPIGVFDSGIGGLTVVSELMRQLPQEDIVYVGDNARCPYGSRSPQQVKQFSFEIMDFLVGQGVKMIIIACNTATAAALEEAKMRYAVPILGVISPGSRAAIGATHNSRVAVIGTEVTVQSGAYTQEIQRINPRLSVVSQACPPFVNLVEQGLYDSPQAAEVVAEYLAPVKKQMVDTLILGCTHYPLLAPLIQQVMGTKVTVLSSAEETARDASTMLALQNMLRDDNPHPNHRFYTSGSVASFQEIGEKWLGLSIEVDTILFS